MIKLSVIIPAYNEAENFRSGDLDEMIDYLEKQKYKFEVIIVDDGSDDNTLDVLNDFAKNHKLVKVLANKHMGKSGAVKAGIDEASGEWRLFTDFDQSTPIQELEKFWPFTQKGFDVIVGSRELSESIRDKEPWYRHLMGRGFNWIVRFFTVRGINDTQCGFKMFSIEASRLFDELKVTIEPSRVPFTGAFDVELLFLAQKRQYKIVEVPIHWHHHETDRVSPVKDSLKMFWQVVKIWSANLTGKYDT